MIVANFVAEFMVLAGAWQFNIALAVLATMGLIVSVTYSMRILQKVFHQAKPQQNWSDSLVALKPREWVAMGSLTVAIVWVGFFPQSIVKAATAPFNSIINNEIKQTSYEPEVKQPDTILLTNAMSENSEKGGEVW